MNIFHTFLCFYCWLGAGVINYFVIYFDVNTPSVKKNLKEKKFKIMQEEINEDMIYWDIILIICNIREIMSVVVFYSISRWRRQYASYLHTRIIWKVGDLKWTPDLIFRKNNANRCKCVIRYWDISRLLTWSLFRPLHGLHRDWHMTTLTTSNLFLNFQNFSRPREIRTSKHIGIWSRSYIIRSLIITHR